MEINKEKETHCFGRFSIEPFEKYLKEHKEKYIAYSMEMGRMGYQICLLW